MNNDIVKKEIGKLRASIGGLLTALDPALLPEDEEMINDIYLSLTVIEEELVFGGELKCYK